MTGAPGPTGATGATGATGPAGAPNTLSIGTVGTGTPSANITGTAPNQVLNLVFPTGFVPTGAWNSATAYTVGEVVTANGLSFYVVTNNTNVTPPATCTSNATWSCVFNSNTAVAPSVGLLAWRSLVGNSYTSPTAPTSTWNLFNVNGTTVGAVSSTTGLVDASQTLYIASPYVWVYGLTQIISNVAFHFVGSDGYVFTDCSYNVLSGAAANLPVNTPITVPANACYFRGTLLPAGLSSMVILPGNVAPSGWTDYGFAPAPSAGFNNSLQLHVAENVSSTRNLLNYANIVTGFQVVVATGALGAVSGYSSSGYVPVQPSTQYSIGASYGSNATYGMSFYDANQIFVSSIAQPWAAGYTFTTPANAAYMRVSMGAVGGASNNLNTMQIVPGTTYPNGYLGFAQTPPPTDVAGDTILTASSQLVGKNIGMWGHSLVNPGYLYTGPYWQARLSAKVGATWAFNDGQPGHGFYNIFANYPNLSLTSMSSPSVGIAGIGVNGGAGTSGTTITQDMTNIDELLIWFGDNDYNLFNAAGQIGAVTDTPTFYSATTLTTTGSVVNITISGSTHPSVGQVIELNGCTVTALNNAGYTITVVSGQVVTASSNAAATGPTTETTCQVVQETFYGAINNALNVLFTAKPSLHILLVDHYYAGRYGAPAGLAIYNQIEAIEQAGANQWGSNIIPMMEEGGINPNNWATFLNSDHIHPTTTGWNKLIPVLARNIMTR